MPSSCCSNGIRTALARTAYLVTRDREAIQDIMQEALIQIWRDLRSYRPYGSFKAWMLKITLNKARKHYRKKRVQTVPHWRRRPKFRATPKGRKK